MKRDLELPWMKQKEIEVLWELLKNRRPENSLEWGCGYSTSYFTGLLRGSFKWTSIEHIEEWARVVREKNKGDNVEIRYVPSDVPGAKGEGTFDQYKSYIESPEKGKPYDFILIDGRARKHCAKKAFEMIADDGVVVIHDANRESYLKYIQDIPHQLLLQDYRTKEGGMWIGSKALPLESVIDIEHHKKAWKVQTTISRIVQLRFISDRFRSSKPEKGWKPAD
ncbi:MAG: class I SAM-dependent methyltransferase [Imperialibacter sp.]